MKPIYHILLSILLIIATAVVSYIIVLYEVSHKFQDNLFIVNMIIYIAAVIWIGINIIRMFK